jgi:hypothetical protein
LLISIMSPMIFKPIHLPASRIRSKWKRGTRRKTGRHSRTSSLVRPGRVKRLRRTLPRRRKKSPRPSRCLRSTTPPLTPTTSRARPRRSGRRRTTTPTTTKKLQDFHFFLKTLPNGPFKGHQIRYEKAFWLMTLIFTLLDINIV